VRRHLPEEELTNVFEAKATLNAPVQALSTQALSTQALSDSNFNPASFDDELNGIELETDVESGTLELSARKPA
jgi:hypothetical protein